MLWSFARTSLFVYKSKIRAHLSPGTVQSIDTTKEKVRGYVDLAKAKLANWVHSIPGYTRVRKSLEMIPFFPKTQAPTVQETDTQLSIGSSRPDLEDNSVPDVAVGN